MTCPILSTSLKTQGILFDTLFHRSYCVSGSLSNLFLFFFFLHIYYNMNCFHITSFFKKIFNGGQASHLSSVSLWIAQPFLICSAYSKNCRRDNNPDVPCTDTYIVFRAFIFGYSVKNLLGCDRELAPLNEISHGHQSSIEESD